MSEQADNAKSAITDDVAEQLAIIMAISKEMGIKYPDVVSQADAMMAAGVKHHDDMRQVLAATLVMVVFINGNYPQFKKGTKLVLEAISNAIEAPTVEMDS